MILKLLAPMGIYSLFLVFLESIINSLEQANRSMQWQQREQQQPQKSKRRKQQQRGMDR